MKTSAPDPEEATEAVDGVHLAQLVAGESMSIQHYVFEPGAGVPVHSHVHEQSGYIYEGTLTFFLDGREIEVGPEESYVLESEEPHGVENRGTVPAAGVDVFSPPRPNPPWTAGEDSTG